MKSLPTRLDLIKELVKPGSVGAEIGVYRGGFSRQLAERGVAYIYCIDAWTSYEAYAKDSLCHTNQADNYAATMREMMEFIHAGRCEIIKGFSDVVGLSWSGPSLDWVFLDANHSYESTLKDLVRWSTNLKDNGIIMCHDFTDTSAGAVQMGFGVVKAVNEFCKNSGWTITHTTQEHDWPSCALRRL